MEVKLVKFRDMLTKRIKDHGGIKAGCEQDATINVCMGDEELEIESITGFNLTSEIYINVQKPKEKGKLARDIR